MTRERGPGLAGDFSAALVAGAVSGALYLSVLFSSLFLVPVQSAFCRFGRRAGIMAAGSAILAVAMAQTIAFAGIGASTIPASILGFLPIMALAGGMVLVNAAFWARVRGLWRVSGVAGLLAVGTTPFVIALVSAPGFRIDLERLVSGSLAPLFQAAAGSPEGSATYEDAVIAATFVPTDIVALWLRMLSSSFVALLLAVIGINWWLGGRLASRFITGTGEIPASPALRHFRVPAVLLWPFLAAWAALGAALLLNAPPLLEAAAWNAALSLALVYGAQGVGIAAHLLDRLGTPRGIRLALGASVVAACTLAPASAFAIAAFPLLGVTEAWIPYRTRKGAGT